MSEETGLFSGKLGNAGSYELDFVDGMINVSVSYESPYATGSVAINLELIQLLKLAALKTDNKIDDVLIGLVASALGD